MTLSILRCPDAAPPETRTAEGGEFSIGRGSDNSWVLPDPGRDLSRCHCVLAFRDGGWQLADTSTNGTFLNREGRAVGAGVIRDLRDGDRLRLGPYEIEVLLEEAVARADAASKPEWTADPLLVRPANPFEDNLLAPPSGISPAPEPVDSLLRETDSACLPPDFDPLAPEDLLGPTQPDHGPSTSDAFCPPPLTPSHLPDDWDDPLVPPWPEPTRPEPPQRPDVLGDAALHEGERAGPGWPRPPPVFQQQAAGADRGDLLHAFLTGTGLTDAMPQDPEAAMRALGAAFRALVTGLRGALIARSAVKGEFRIEQTMVQARGNNPLKFSADDDDALAALLGAGRRTEMAPADAVADALRDIRLHELASVAAMQAAVRTLLQGLDPAAIRASAEARGGLSALLAQHKARAWDAYEALYARTVAALSDDFDSVFGRAFARAYEQALRDINGAETP